MKFTIPGDPIGKPRMTRCDKWKQRDCVVAYRSWADSARAAIQRTTKLTLKNPTTLIVTAYFQVPESWSHKRKSLALTEPHTVKPDADNVLKAVCDALFENDQMVTEARICKKWAGLDGPRIHVELTEL